MTKEAELQGQYEQDLIFYVNGEKVVIKEPDPTLLLVDYLRFSEVGLTGTKKACGQGGCGACTVMLSHYDPTLHEVHHAAINACLRPLCSLDGMAVTTVEGLGSVNTEISPVQYRIAKDNGSQCGYCTPGFVMNMHSFLVANQGKAITKKEIEDIFDGNICRCTGFRPILHAMKKFASDWSPQDQTGTMRCLKEGDMPCQVDPAERVKHYDQPKADFPAALKRPPRALFYRQGQYHWYRPLTLAAVYQLMAHYRTDSNLKLVVGNTSIGIYNKYVENPQVLVDISQVVELKKIEAKEDGLVVGAGVTYSEFIAALDQLLPQVSPEKRAGLEALRTMAGRTAGTMVRNAASLAGNTMLVVRHINQGEPFPSDLFTAFCTVGAVLTVGSSRWAEPRQYPILAFAEAYQREAELREEAVILAYFIPYTTENEYARTYKVARREVNAHSIVNGGCKVKLSEQNIIEEAIIVLGGIAPVAFYARQTQKYLAGRPWEAATLDGALKTLRAELEAIMARYKTRLSGLIDEGFSDTYKQHLAESFLYQFFVYVAEQVAPETIPATIESAGIRYQRPVSTGSQTFQTYKEEYPVSFPFISVSAFMQATGEAKYTHDIPLPMRGLQGAFVTSTQALANFYFQIPEGSGYRQVSPTELKTYLKETFPGVVDFITAGDIPPGGVNIQGIGGDDPLFSEGDITYFGQSIGLVVAETESLALDVAHFVQTNCLGYEPVRDPFGQEKEPILTIAEARAQNSIFEDCPKTAPHLAHIWKITRPGSDLDWRDNKRSTTLDGVACRVIHGSQDVGSQIHFYMETQACLAEPGEHQEMLVQPSSQSTDSVQGAVMKTLAIPANNVNVRVKRLGGGYGGKIDRTSLIAAPIALAAWKLKRPVRVALPREVDAAMIGKRHPVHGEYHLAIGSGEDNSAHKGKIMGWQTTFWADGGNTYDCSFVVMDCLQLRCDNAYLVPHYQTEGNVCRTNKASNTSFRSMGMVQATLIQEDALEAAAHALGMPPEEVRGQNLYRWKKGEPPPETPYGQPVEFCYLENVWNYLLKKINFWERAAQVAEFNQNNRWRKRGISMIPVKYGMGFNLTGLEQGGALVEVYDSDGSVLVRHGGIEMGQGLMIKVAQIAAKTLNLPLSLIHMTESETSVVPNPISTGASTGTEFNGEAVRQACEDIRTRLEEHCQAYRQNQKYGEAWCRKKGINYWDYPEGWRKSLPTPSGHQTLIWNNIVQLAYWDRVNLSAQTRVRIPGGEPSDQNFTFQKPGCAEPANYYNGFTFSAACTEVEIDVLTGETTVLQADIMYDMGKSLNPAIDIGQVEGAFVQGLGYVLTEELVFQPDGESKGALNTLNTWRYKPPAFTTIPLEFNVHLFPPGEAAGIRVDPNLRLWSSKEVGEPPLVLAATAFFAVKHAILAARQDRGHSEWFKLDSPATVQRIREACLVEVEDLTI